MKTTVEIPDDLLKTAMRVAGTNSPQQAVVAAIKEFNVRHGQSELIGYLGTFDSLMSLQELDDMRNQE